MHVKLANCDELCCTDRANLQFSTLQNHKVQSVVTKQRSSFLLVFTLYILPDFTSTACGEYFIFVLEGLNVPYKANSDMLQFGGFVRLKYSALQPGQQPRPLWLIFRLYKLLSSLLLYTTVHLCFSCHTFTSLTDQK